MSIVVIASNHDRERGDLAEHTAGRLDYRLVTMDDLIQAAGEEYHVAARDFNRLVKEPGLWHHVLESKKKKLWLVSLLEHELCKIMAEDRLVFAGCLGLPIFQEISHALKVLVLVHHEEKEDNEKSGMPLLPGRKSGQGPAAWFEKIYGVNLEDPNFYDLTLNLWHMDAAEAADIIVSTLDQKRFTPMTYSLQCLVNMELACRVKTVLIRKLGDLEVKAHDGIVYLYSATFRKWGRKAAKAVKEEVMRLPGVNYVEVYRQRQPFEEVRPLPSGSLKAG